MKNQPCARLFARHFLMMRICRGCNGRVDESLSLQSSASIPGEVITWDEANQMDFWTAFGAVNLWIFSIGRFFFASARKVDHISCHADGKLLAGPSHYKMNDQCHWLPGSHATCLCAGTTRVAPIPIYVCIYVCIHEYIYMYIYIYIYNICLFIHLFIYLFIYSLIYLLICLLT